MADRTVLIKKSSSYFVDKNDLKYIVCLHM